MKLTIILASMLLFTGKAFALESEDILHITAHFGATYVITHVTEVVCTKVAGSKHKIACTIAGIALANAINIGRKVEQGLPNDTNRAIISGAAGSFVAGVLINF